MLSWSYSKLKTFALCPKKYWFSYIQKIKEDESDQISQGQLIHKYLEERVRDGTPIPPDYREKLEPVALLIESKKGTRHAELELAIDADFNPVSWFSSQAWGRAKIDIVVEDGETAIVGDYKTGKKQYADNFQLRISAAMLFIHKPEIQRIAASFVWIPGGTAETLMFERNECEGLWKEIFVATDRVEVANAKNNWPAKPGFSCKYCAAAKKGICEFAKEFK